MLELIDKILKEGIIFLGKTFEVTQKLKNLTHYMAYKQISLVDYYLIINRDREKYDFYKKRYLFGLLVDFGRKKGDI